MLSGGGPGEVGANARSEPAGGHARHAACPRPDDRTRRRSDHQHRLDRRAGNNRPRLTRVRGGQGRGDPVHGLPGTAARDDRRAGQLHLPGPGRHAGLTPITGPDVAGRARRSSPGTDARRHRDGGDGIPHRRHPGRADHAVSRRGAWPASAAYRRADGTTRPDCSGRRASGRRRFRFDAAARRDSSEGGFDDAAQGDELLLAAGRADELQGGGQPRAGRRERDAAPGSRPG